MPFSSFEFAVFMRKSEVALGEQFNRSGASFSMFQYPQKSHLMTDAKHDAVNGERQNIRTNKPAEEMWWIIKPQWRHDKHPNPHTHKTDFMQTKKEIIITNNGIRKCPTCLVFGILSAISCSHQWPLPLPLPPPGHTNFAIEFIQANEFSILVLVHFFYRMLLHRCSFNHRRCYSMKCALRYVRPFAVIHKS